MSIIINIFVYYTCFQSEEDWQEFQLENDPRFLQRIQSARQSIKSGRGIRLEEITL